MPRMVQWRQARKLLTPKAKGMLAASRGFSVPQTPMMNMDGPALGDKVCGRLRTVRRRGPTPVQGTTDYEKCPEMAELFRYGSWTPVWFLTATQAGTIVITDASGADEELGTVEEALARMLALEQPPTG